MKILQVMKGPNEIVPFDHPFIKYPQYASIKMDGYRLLNLCGEHLLSPALKPFPNRNMTEHLYTFLKFCQEHRIVTDGEFWSPSLTFQQLQSVVRSHDKPIPNDVCYYIFDAMSEAEWDTGHAPPFAHRIRDVVLNLVDHPHIVRVEQDYIQTAVEAETLFEKQIENGQEGIILRNPSTGYKHGRCTTKQDGMWKFKQFITQDAVIVGVEEQMKMREGLERTTNVVGHLERSYKAEDYVPAGRIGAFVVKKFDLNSDREIQFKVKPGKGYDDAWKTSMWYLKDSLTGKHIEFKFMPHGTMDKPRIGNLVRFRPDLD
jgi:ATP-dependent DNA ligase